MSNLLLITDMARLIKSFERLADNKTCSLRVANSLEKGGDEIAAEKPDVVFVQTHLSGLSADILLMHLKKQLGRKRSRFVLLAGPGQAGKDILKTYQGWIDISCEDNELLPAIQNILATLLPKNKIPAAQVMAPDKTLTEFAVTEPVTGAETSALLNLNSGKEAHSAIPVTDPAPPVPAAATTEASLEEQGLTYSPRPRLSVYSEFNSSFDSAVNRTPEAESIVRAAPKLEHSWNPDLIDTIETAPSRSKRATFLLWLAPVVVAVIIVTFLQKNRTASKPVAVIAPPAISIPAPAKSAEQAAVAPVQPAVPQQSVTAQPDQDVRMTDKAVITAIAENRGAKGASAQSAENARLSDLPDFIPRYGVDKQYGITNPGWERYKGQVTEFKVLREGKTIKAIQVIDRGGQGVPESFMKGVLRQVSKKPVFTVETSEKKEGYEIQRGRVTDSLRVVYYRDEEGGKLRAFVMTWQ